MMYQILPRYDYIFHNEEMEMFLKTLSGIKQNKMMLNGFKSLFDTELSIYD